MLTSPAALLTVAFCSSEAHKDNSVRYGTRKFLAAFFFVLFFKQWVLNSQLLLAHLSASCMSWLAMLSLADFLMFPANF